MYDTFMVDHLPSRCAQLFGCCMVLVCSGDKFFVGNLGCMDNPVFHVRSCFFHRVNTSFRSLFIIGSYLNKAPWPKWHRTNLCPCRHQTSSTRFILENSWKIFSNRNRSGVILSMYSPSMFCGYVAQARRI